MLTIASARTPQQAIDEGCDHPGRRCARCANPRVHESCIAVCSSFFVLAVANGFQVPKDCWAAAMLVMSNIQQAKEFAGYPQQPIPDSKLYVSFLYPLFKMLGLIRRSRWISQQAMVLEGLIKESWRVLRAGWNATPRVPVPSQPPDRVLVIDDEDEETHSGWGASSPSDEEDDDRGVTFGGDNTPPGPPIKQLSSSPLFFPPRTPTPDPVKDVRSTQKG